MTNYFEQHALFEKYVKALGSKFAAVVYVSKLARQRAKSVDNCILESEALSWVLTGVEPKAVAIWRTRKNKKEELAKVYAKDRLMYVEDIDVRSAVEDSIDESIKGSHLIYLYNNVRDKDRQARVRILSRMIWDEMMLIDIEDRRVLTKEVM